MIPSLSFSSFSSSSFSYPPRLSPPPPPPLQPHQHQHHYPSVSWIYSFFLSSPSYQDQEFLNHNHPRQSLQVIETLHSPPQEKKKHNHIKNQVQVQA